MEAGNNRLGARQRDQGHNRWRRRGGSPEDEEEGGGRNKKKEEESGRGWNGRRKERKLRGRSRRRIGERSGAELLILPLSFCGQRWS